MRAARVARLSLIVLLTLLAFAAAAVEAAGAATVQSGARAWPSPVPAFSNIEVVGQPIHDACSDGGGGAIVVTCLPIGLSADNTVDVQRIAADGSKPWGDTPQIVCDTWGQYGGEYMDQAIACCPDGAGGAIIVWFDMGSQQYMAQHVDQNGDRLWENGAGSDDYPGISIGSGTRHFKPRILADGAGGAFVAWMNPGSWGNPNSHEIRVQHLSGAGVEVWTSGGVVAAPTQGDQDQSGAILSGLCLDSAGGLCVAFSREYEVGLPEHTFKASFTRVLANGGMPAATAEVPAGVTSIYWQIEPKVVIDGDGNAIVAWSDGRPASGTEHTDAADIYAQRIDLTTGAREWADAGVLVCGAAECQQHVALVPGPDGGAIAIWEDTSGHNESGYSHLSSNLVGAAGTTVWSDASGRGVLIHDIEDAMYQNMWSASGDGGGGAYVAWTDVRNVVAPYYTDCSLYAQHLAGDGAVLWGDSRAAENVTELVAMATPRTFVGSDGQLGLMWAQTPSGASADFTMMVQKMVDSEDPPVPVIDDAVDPGTGDSLTLSGMRFGMSDASSSVTFQTPAGSVTADITAWRDTWIRTGVPASTALTSVTVTTSRGTSNTYPLDWTPPTLVSYAPARVFAGGTVTVTGQDFGATAGTFTLGSESLAVSSWSDTAVTLSLPKTAWGSQDLQAQTAYGSSNTLAIAIAPHLHRLSASRAHSGARLTLKGCGFGPSKGKALGTVRFGTRIARVLSWSNTAIVVRVPKGPAGSIKVKVTTLGGVSNLLRLRRL